MVPDEGWKNTNLHPVSLYPCSNLFGGLSEVTKIPVGARD